MILFTLLFLIFPSTVLFLAMFWFTAKEKPSKLVLPGDKGLPFIGEILSLLKPHPANSLGDFMEDHISRYGRIFSSRLLGRDAVISADVGLNRFVQKNDAKLFATAKLPGYRDIFGKESLVLADGEARKRLRSAHVDFHMSTKRLQTVFLREADFLASTIVSSWKDGSVISAKEESIKYSMQIMAKITLSIMPDDHKMELLLKDYSHFTSALFSIPVKFPGMKYRKAIKARQNIVNMIKEIMDERADLIPKDFEEIEKQDRSSKKVEGQEEDYDLLDFLKRKTKFSDEVIVDFLLGTLFAGHETTSRAITFMLYLLMGSPTIVKRLQEEHLQIIKSKSKLEQKISWNDYNNLTFTNCVINETLRLSNVVPFIPKMATQDVKYEDIVIPKDCLILVHMRAVHLDPSIYYNPTQFNPWRWLDPISEKNIRAYMPFGGGAKMCPGANVAKLEMAIFLHHVILNYELEMVEHDDQPMGIPYPEFSKGLPIRIHDAHIF